MTEYERTFRVPDANATRDYLKKHSYPQQSKHAQDDTYFLVDHENSEGNKEYLRVRKNRIQDTASLDYHVVLEDGEIHQEEIIVSDSHTTVEILEALGHDIECVVKKDREVYQKDTTKIIIDHVAVLGTFIQVEVEADDQKAADKQLQAVAQEIGLEERAQDRYPHLQLALEQ